LETIRENVKIFAKGNIGYYELKKHMPWLDEGSPELLDQRKLSQIAVVTGSKRNKWG
jgi:hypothetical protein